MRKLSNYKLGKVADEKKNVGEWCGVESRARVEETSAKKEHEDDGRAQKKNRDEEVKVCVCNQYNKLAKVF